MTLIDNQWRSDRHRRPQRILLVVEALITELVASRDYEEVFDLVMELQDGRRDEQDKVADFNRLIAVVEEKIHGKIGLIWRC
ncbi:hypothetical protein Tco_0534278 [Tanacetum coccineum]